MSKTILQLFIFLSFAGVAQNELRFEPVMGKDVIILNDRIDGDGKWTEISTLRFYISNLKVFSGKTSWSYPVRYLLIDLEDPSSLLVKDLPEKIDSLSFSIGIDSTTNVSGILDGALDPINGMYWAWNSGYINFKLEGKCSASINPNKGFEFHLGGYLSPFQTVQHKSLVLPADRNNIVQVDLLSFLSMIDWSSEPNVMIPGPQAKQLSEQLPLLFKLKQ